QIQNKIFTIRGVQVMIDSDLAELYNVETGIINRAAKRNINRFPEKFRFQILEEEKQEVITNCDHLKKLKFSPALPYVFTEQGVAMLSAVLKSEVADKISIQIINAFANMRRFISSNASVFARIDSVERKKWFAFSKFDKNSLTILNKLRFKK
ncbi:MAG: ORF6N domain-containing protein, partial [Candidatus Marinimicrobia bacterium]|nr:ORF6N domain-containing protein [Candidatus Neomarinimicrobiota bacterium]